MPAYIGSDRKPDAEAIRNLMSDLDYTINGFDKAVTSSSEIMVECAEYYVIPYSGDGGSREQGDLEQKAWCN